MGITMKRCFPDLKSFAICDAQHGMKKNYATLTGVISEDAEWTRTAWDRVDAYLSGDASISEFDTEFAPDPATDIIEFMWGITNSIADTEALMNDLMAAEWKVLPDYWFQ